MKLISKVLCDCDNGITNSGDYCQMCDWETVCASSNCAGEPGGRDGDSEYCEECELEKQIARADFMNDLEEGR